MPLRNPELMIAAMDTSTPFHDLLAAAKAGERPALDELLRRHQTAVRRKVHAALERDLRRNRPWLAAMFSTGDVVQEVLIAVIRDLDDFHGIDEPAFAGYVASLIRNRLVDSIRFHEAMRRDARRTATTDELAGPCAEPRSERDEPSRSAEIDDELARFCSVLASFPTREALLLRERLQEERTFPELADELGYPSPDAARKAFYTAHARLLAQLNAAGIRPGGSR